MSNQFLSSVVTSLFVLSALHFGIASSDAREVSDDWFEFSKDVNNTSYHIKIKDLLADSQKNTIRKVWIKADHSSDKTKTDRSTMTLYSIDCSQGKLGVIQAASYSSTGSSTSSVGPFSYPRMGFAVPESIGESVMEIACPK